MRKILLSSWILTTLILSTSGSALANNNLVDLANGVAPDGYKVKASDHLEKPTSSDIKIPEYLTLNSVPQRRQEGPTCGLYALGMIMDFWHSKNKANPTAKATALEQCAFPPTTQEVMLDHVQQKGYSLKGEVFKIENLAKTAAHYGLKAGLYQNAKMEDIYKVLDAGRPVLIAFDVNFMGEVSTNTEGLRAHYAVLEGYFDDAKTGKRYLVAKHGWAWKNHHIWSAVDFEKSWRGLKKTNFYKTQGYDCHNMPAPMRLQPLDENHHAILDHLNVPALANAFVEIVEPSQSLLGGKVIKEGSEGTDEKLAVEK